MANKWDWPWAAGGALPALGLSFLLGGLAGALMAALAGGEGARELSAYLSDYLILAGQEGAAARFCPLLWGRLRDLLIALILGMTALGAVGLPVLFAARGFLFAFSVGCFCRVFGGAGLFPAFALFGLSARRRAGDDPGPAADGRGRAERPRRVLGPVGPVRRTGAGRRADRAVGGAGAAPGGRPCGFVSVPSLLCVSAPAGVGTPKKNWSLGTQIGIGNRKFVWEMTACLTGSRPMRPI